ncbi:MAG: hypothetical protein FWD83_01115 [Promicromonosporaceae bacterium]|nr:hypothetical protein [Promicromonosporaceae bacterium]
MSTTASASGEAAPVRAYSDESLRDLLTTARLRSYLRTSSGDLNAALRLYEWNADASSAVLVTVSMVEALARNAMDSALVAWADRRRLGDWFGAAPLDNKGYADIHKARERATGFGRRPEDHGKVVAELGLGFWRYLASKRYLTTLWTPALTAAFPHGPADPLQRLRAVEHRMAMLHHIRNRACHHEPIHRRDLVKDYREAVELASWVHPDGGAWVAERSMIPVLVASRPFGTNSTATMSSGSR